MKNSLIVIFALTLALGACGKSDKSESKGKSAPVETVSPDVAATISGKVKFSGKAPKAKSIKLSGDAFCVTKHAKVKSDEVVVNKNKTLKNVLVYVKKGLEGRSFAMPTETAVLDQNGCWYSPHVLAIMVNQPLLVRNSDETLHNIHAVPKINKGFNFAQPIKGMETKKKFTKEEVMIKIKCDVHSWMGGYIGVISHPYFQVTGGDGSFSLKNLPPGQYVVEAWHEKYGVKTRSVTVGAKESKKINFTFGAGSS